MANEWNRRVLIRRGMPQGPELAADMILGPSAPAGGLADDEPGADALRGHRRCFAAESLLAVADTGNNRVLIWDAAA